MADAPCEAAKVRRSCHSLWARTSVPARKAAKSSLVQIVPMVGDQPVAES